MQHSGAPMREIIPAEGRSAEIRARFKQNAKDFIISNPFVNRFSTRIP
jgi:hypothetical protein